MTLAPGSLFRAAPTANGWEVIEESTGRPVTGERETLQSANGTAYHLNQAARGGNRALARALKSA